MSNISLINWENLKGELRYSNSNNKHSDIGKYEKESSKPSLFYKDNYFEELAIKYLVNTSQDDRWIRTNDTIPGHDGCLCIYYDGFMTEWWMEAKYSLTPNNLSRGRIDATIIEVLLNKNKSIERLFIITNCDISSKIKNDIHTVITNHSNCNHIEFVTRDLLELWLINHYDVYEQFFYLPIPKSKLQLPSNIFITRDLEIYDIMDSQRLHITPQHILYHKKQYFLYFSVYSPDARSIKITSDYFILDQNEQKIELNEGINECKIMASLVTDREVTDIIGIKLYDVATKKYCDCKTSCSVSIIPYKNDVIFTVSQNSCLTSIEKYINNDSNQFQLFSIYGLSGMGKTYVSKHISEIIAEKHMIELESFVEDPYVNAKHILRTLLYIYFPYAYGFNISDSIKKVIRNNFNTGIFLHKLTDIDIPNHPERLLSLLRETSDMYLFPPLHNDHRQYIVWDNVSKLDSGLQRFANLFLSRLKKNNENITFIIVQNEPLNGTYVTPTDVYEIDITDKDIACALELKLNNNIKQYFPDLLSLYDLKSFLSDYSLQINTLEDFQINYIKFLNSENRLTFIERKISDLSFDEKLILNRIYYSYTGLSIYDFEAESGIKEIHSIILKLLNNNLIKYSAEHKLIPYHDIYLAAYKQKYGFDEKAFEIVGAKSEEEKLKNQLLSITYINAGLYCDSIKGLLGKHEYSSVYFILEELYKYEKLLKSQIGHDNFLLLKYYRIYADANVKMSGMSAYSQFRELWEEVKEIELSKENYILKLHTLYELSNAAYDNFDYIRCLNYKSHAQIIEREMSILGYNRSTSADIDYCYNQIDYMVILSKSELGECVKFEECDNREGAYRFLRSQCTSYDNIISFIDFAKSTLTTECYQNNIKHFVKADFDVAFLETITEKKVNLWYNDLKNKCQKFDGMNRNYFIKAQYSIISALLVFRSFNNAEKALKSLFVGMTENPRMQFFYIGLKAALYAIKNDIANAINLLDKQYSICKDIDSYAKIVKHNIAIMKDGTFNDEFKFCLDAKELSCDAFLLDHRCFY